MLRKDWGDLNTNGAKGDWCFMNTDLNGLMVIVRFGADAMLEVAALYLDKELAPKKYPVWQWNGNKEVPTLTPSILVHGAKDQPDRWHGFLTDGKLIEV